MTCIVAVKENSKVFIGGDSAAVAEDGAITIRKDTKVFKNGDFLIGFAGSYRFGQLMHYHFKPPKPVKDKADHHFMCVDFIRQMQKILKEHEYALADGDGLLVGYNEELYEINEDFQVGISTEEFGSIGVGRDLALGSMRALEITGSEMEAKKRIAIALTCAASFNTGVSGPWTILKL